ncbi:MAG: spore maturation protein [Verrucomicrobia bacterium]|nr:spore maturation protein [Verrucomicrobiota bacterium]
MLNYIWLGLIVAAVLIGAINGSLEAVSKEAFDRVEFAVMKLALPLAGIMALWLGVMRLAEKAGLIQILARWLRPVMRRLFPDVPVQHPAMGSMLMNMAANILGLANAATPLGIRAMKDLETLNPRPGIATNAMCTFLAVNTSSIQLIPATAVGILAVNGSSKPSAIVGTAILATVCSTIAGITAVKLLEKLPGYRLATVAEPVAAGVSPGGKAVEVSRRSESSSEVPGGKMPPSTAGGTPATTEWARLHVIGKFVLVLFMGVFAWAFLRVAFPGLFEAEAAADAAKENPFIRSVNAVSLLSIPFLLSFFPLYAALRKVKVYEEFVEGAKEGFQVSVMIIPYLVAIFVAIGMFRAAGGIEMLTTALKPVLDLVGFPTELLPMCLVRPLSGSGTLGLFTDLVKEFGPDSLIALTGATIFGSTETTFYVIAVYFGAVNVRRTRHAVPAGLIADAVGIIASILICKMMFG